MSFIEEHQFPLRLLATHDYAFIDSVMLGDTLSELPIQRDALVPLVPRELQTDERQMPALLSLQAMPAKDRIALQALMEESYLNRTAMPVTCLFRTQSSLEIVRQHCLKKLILQSPDLRKFFLRFYDPRVLVHLLYLFDAEQLAGLFMGLQAYSFFLDGAWHTVTAPQVSVDLAKYRVSQNQLEKIQRIQTMNRVLDPLSDRPRYTTIHAEVYRRYCENIDQLVVRAEQQLGLTLEEDQALFACHALTIHPAFDQHPKIKTLLSQRNSQEQSYTDMAALLSESDWQQIRQECKHGLSSSALI